MKITRQESNLHDEAVAFLERKNLSEDEQEFVYRNWNPMANHNVGKGGIYFTPVEIAQVFAQFVGGGSMDTTIDLCAGTGILTWALNLYRRNDKHTYICVEINHEFVKIGKKLLPFAHWYEGSVFDRDLLLHIQKKHGPIDYAISNPPYGYIPIADTNWMFTKGPAQWRVAEIAVRLCWGGGEFLMPDNCVEYDIDHSETRKPAPHEKYFNKFPGVHFMPEPAVYDDIDWKGADPTTRIVDVCVDDVPWQRPYGLGDNVKQTNLF